MPDVSGPFDLSSFQQGSWYRDRSSYEPSGVNGPPVSTAAAGDLGLTVAGLVGTLALGRAHIRGAYYERTGSAFSYTHPANTDPANPRIDRYVLRRDLVAKTVVPAVLQGTPAATPAVPPLTQVENGTWEFPLFQALVPAASGTTLTVTDERRYLPLLRQHPTVGLELWDGTRYGSPLAASQWVDDLNATSYSYSLTTVVGNPTGMAVRSMTLPPGHTLEVDMSVPLVAMGVSSSGMLQLFVWVGVSASQAADAANIVTPSAGNGMQMPVRLNGSYTNTTSTDQTVQWSVAAQLVSGTVGLQQGNGAVRLRHRVI